MVSRALKLKPTAAQTAQLNEWFVIAGAVWNWGLGKLRATEREGWMYRARYETLCADVRGHGPRIGFNSQALYGILKDLCGSWDLYRRGEKGRPRWKGERNPVSSIPFRNDKRFNNLRIEGQGIRIPTLGVVKARRHRDWPAGQVICIRLQRTPRGWYAVVVIDGEPNAIARNGDAAVGVDLGYSTLATLSTGEKIEHPREIDRLGQRIAQASRGRNNRLAGRVQQRLALARRKRNHAISRDLVSRFGSIYVSKDNLKGMQRTFGKSVLSAGHYTLRLMLASKCRQAGRVYVEVPSRNSTRTCSSCGALTGPTGLRGLSVRDWVCSARGAPRDRDVNAARNTLNAGAALAHEMAGNRQSETGDRPEARLSPVLAASRQDRGDR